MLVRFPCGRKAEDVAVTPVRTVTETVVVLPRVTVEGVTVQVELAGAPEQVKVRRAGDVRGRAEQQRIHGVLTICDGQTRLAIRIQTEINPVPVSASI